MISPKQPFKYIFYVILNIKLFKDFTQAKIKFFYKKEEENLK